ncbi:MAG TPA: glycosyltransferase [Pyrinomonadaceae bacterium]|nr:glycosyltransferase [Pyrinomonadaceae bacterium]
MDTLNHPASNFTQRQQTERVLCVLSPQRDAYSQTFVRAHKDYLPATIRALYTTDYETFSTEDGPLVNSGFTRRAARAVARRLVKVEHSHFEQRAVREFLLRNNVDAVLAEFAPTATLIMDACKQTQIPLIAHFHGFDAYRRSTLESFGHRYPELFQSAAAIIAVSRDMQDQLVELGAPREKLHYNSCGADTSIFHGADPLNSPPTFVAVGRFVDKKAPHLTLLAFKATVEVVREARLIMLGDGPLWEACYQIRKALGLSESVELLGPQSQSDVAGIMRKARSFVQHSIKTQDGDSEGTPVAVLEAGASGLPVVATRHAGIKEAVIEGKTGLLIDEGDITAMAEQMIRLAKDPSLAARLGTAAREWILAEYSMEKSIANLWTIIEGALGVGTSRFETNVLHSS